MKHSPAIFAWVIAGAIGLTIGLAQTAEANIISVIGKATGAEGGDNKENGTVGQVNCGTATCEGLADTDLLAIPDYPGTDEGSAFTSNNQDGNVVLTDAPDDWDPNKADPYDSFSADLDSVRTALNSALSALGLATVTGGTQTPIASDGAPYCTDGNAVDCTITNLTGLYVVLKNDGFFNFFRVTGITDPYTMVYDQAKYGLSNVYQFGTVIPIPATLPLFLTGLFGLGFLARRRRQAMEA